ncbi:MAG TPA: integrin alpha [Kineosporiaceae bacterium]|nr:integrin alpha [Kineosporiaceae bacterium]
MPLALTVSALVVATAGNGSAAVSGPAAVSLFAAKGAAVSKPLNANGPIAVGVPDLNLPGAKQAGGVDLHLRAGKTQRMTEQKLGLVGSGKGDFHRFGASVIADYVNRDKYPDLVVGAPGLAAKGAKGRVVLLFGSAKGITAKGAQVLSAGEAGDEFGASVVMSQGVLYVGAPGHDVGGVANAGGLYRYSFSAKGKASAIDLLTQSLPALGGVAQANQRFGEVLAAREVLTTKDDGVVIGLPNARVGTAAGAGEMIRLTVDPTTAAFTAEIWTQDSPGVPDTAEAGDHFGAAITTDGYAVGVPGEDVDGPAVGAPGEVAGAIANAGAVQTFIRVPSADSGGEDYAFVPSRLLTQADPKIPGQAEAGDRFGAALTRGIFVAQEAITMAIGAPGEDVGTVTNAGSVTLVGLLRTVDDESSGPPQLLSQGHGLPGTSETGDALGASLGMIFGDGGLEEDRYDTLLIGLPGEDVGTTKAHRNAGRAILWSYRPAPPQKKAFGYSGGDLPGLRYGTVFATDAR